ncbi:putative reverse transcriptase domain-containing protein [Tanacetum coccineum]
MSALKYQTILKYQLMILLFLVDEPCLVCRKVCLDSFAGISSKKEAPVNFLTDPLEGRSTLRPADILVFRWAGRKHACVDLTGVSPLVGLRDNGFVSGQVALKAESSKVAKHEKACLKNQHVFIPFAFDTFGFLAPKAEEFLTRVQRVVQSWSSSLFCLKVKVGQLKADIQDKRGALRKQQPEQKAHVVLSCGRLTKVGYSKEGTFERAIRQSFLGDEKRMTWDLIQPSFVSTVATSTSMMSASDNYGLQRADWMIYLTPTGNQEYTEMCFSSMGKVSHKHTRTSYVGYQNCSTELERKLLERARAHVAMEQAEDAKLLSYTYTPDAVLDCVLIRSFPNFYILKLTPSTPAISLFQFKGVYEFSDLNPFAGHLDPVREGHALFRKGLLSEAVLALDAEVLRNPDNAEGSPMLMVTEMTKHIRVRASRGKTTPSEHG